MNYATITDANKFSRSLLPWQEMGLMETATGYGDKLTTPYKIQYKGHNRRIYCICHSNIGTLYVIVKGVKEYLRDCDVPSCSEIQKERFG